MKVNLISMTENPIETIAKVASNCYDSKPSDSARIVNGCYKSGHTSVFEFVNFHFHIEGVSRALLAQLTRHRLASYCVRSQRYVNEGKFDFVTPSSIANNDGAKVIYDNVMRDIHYYYKKLVDVYDIPMEDARYLLPNACETILDMSINLRSLMNLCNERLCTKAQAEIRKLTSEMVKCIVEKAPELKPYLVPKCEVTEPPVCNERKPCGRHDQKRKTVEEDKSQRMKFLILGRSGSGKDALVDRMCAETGMTKVVSYTTRPRRKGESENKHIFISKEMMDELKNSGELCAYTVFDGYEYGATYNQLLANDFYIIDPDGLEYFQNVWADRPINFYTIGIDGNAEDIAIRMANRGDDKTAVLRRVTHDFVKYGNLNDIVQTMIMNIDFDEAYEEFKKVVQDASEYHNTERRIVYDDGGAYDARTGRPLKGE